MDKAPKNIKKLYYSIGEVSKVSDLKQYVLRYWETEFKQLKPAKNKAGNRTYKQKDIDLIIQIKDLLYNQKFTINGARNILSGDADLPKANDVNKNEVNEVNEVDLDVLIKIRTELKSIIEDLNK